MRFPSLLILALGAVLASNTQLRTLDRRTSAAPWKVFSTKNGDDAFTAYTKKSENGLAVLKVESVWKGPIRVIKEVFRGGEWVSGGSAEAQVEHFSGGVQKQTYTLPWPFSGREYVVKCDAADLSGGGLRTYCRPSDATHVGAPAPGHVRASSETLWEFRPLDDGSTQVYFEGVVDPKGALPKWMVNEVGKHHSVNMVRAITSMAGRVLSSDAEQPRGWFSLLS